MSPEKQFMSLEEVADLLGVDYQLIYRLARSGELPASRIGRVYRVSQKDLDDYLEKTKAGTGPWVCSACGTSYQSGLSVAQKCVECGEPVCVDCWQRRGVRRCRNHDQTK